MIDGNTFRVVASVVERLSIVCVQISHRAVVHFIQVRLTAVQVVFVAVFLFLLERLANRVKYVKFKTRRRVEVVRTGRAVGAAAAAADERSVRLTVRPWTVHVVAVRVERCRVVRRHHVAGRTGAGCCRRIGLCVADKRRRRRGRLRG